MLRLNRTVVAYSYQGELELTPINKIRDGAYIFTMADKVVIAYKNEHENGWSLVCNLGGFDCEEGQVVSLRIDNTEEDSKENIEKNTVLFLGYFMNQNVKHINLKASEKARLEVYIEFFGYSLPDYALNNDFVEINALDRTNIYKLQRYLDTENNMTIFEKFAYYFNLLHNYQEQNKFDNVLERFLRNHNIQKSQDIFDNLPSLRFLEAQKKFIESLTQKEKDILILYSHNGDVFINSFIRNSYTATPEIIKYMKSHIYSFSLYLRHYDNNLDEDILAQTYYTDLMNLIKKAPKVDKEFIVYRGAHTIHHFNGVKNNIYIDRGFVSTSLDPAIAVEEFSGNKYMSIIHVTKNTSCIFNLLSKHPYEMEILLPDKTYFLITKEFQEYNFLKEYDERPSEDLITIKTNELILLHDFT